MRNISVGFSALCITLYYVAIFGRDRERERERERERGRERERVRKKETLMPA